MSRTLIIPSAGLSTRLYPLSQNTPKVMIKLNGVPLFHLLYKKAIECKVDNIVVAINREFKRQLEEFIEDTYKNSEIPIYIQVVDTPEQGVLYSLYCAFLHAECKENALVILSDTLYSAKLPLNDNKSFVVYENVKPPLKRWCLVDTDEFGAVRGFYDKPQGECPTNKALIGIYHVQTKKFLEATEEVLAGHNAIRGEFQISQALDEYRKSEDIFALKAEDGAWHDTGTLENLRQASLDFFISRNFNHIRVDHRTLIKKSSDKKKLRNEFLWFQTVPDKAIIPAIYDYNEHPDSSEISMELCSLADLGTIFNFCKAEKVFFEQATRYVLNLVDNVLYKEEKSEDVRDANYDMFINKLLNRIKKIKSIDMHKDMIVNGQNLKNIYYYLQKFTGKLCQIVEGDKCVRIHGDLILSNILFEPQKMVVKFVDARGEYGKMGVYGDIRYDLAKLLHSLDGKYETILHNLYSLKETDKGIEYRMYMSEAKGQCFNASKNVLFEYAKTKGISKTELKLIEASLYISMIPLHKDDIKRQKAFYITGLRILKEVLK